MYVCVVCICKCVCMCVCMWCVVLLIFFPGLCICVLLNLWLSFFIYSFIISHSMLDLTHFPA